MITRDEIKCQLNEIFQDVFDDDDINIQEQTSASDIEEWDSLMHITLVVAIEKKFSLNLNAAEIGNLKNVGEFLDLLQSKLER